jgi:hypothetical protein
MYNILNPITVLSDKCLNRSTMVRTHGPLNLVVEELRSGDQRVADLG